MKKSLSLLLLFCFFITISCVSSKTSLVDTDEKYRVIEDSILFSQNKEFYQIIKPLNWFAYKKIETTRFLFFSPKKVRNLPLTFQDIYLDVGSSNRYIKVLENLINHDISILNDNIQNFSYQLIKTNHKKYGESYVLKYTTNLEKKSKTYKHLAFYLIYKNRGYCIYYQALEKYFNEFLPDVEKIINSFTINEDYKPT